MRTDLTPQQVRAYEAVRSLRQLSRENNVITTRSQNVILQALPPIDLAAVAQALSQAGE